MHVREVNPVVNSDEQTDPDGEGDEDVGDHDGDDEDKEEVEEVCRVGPRAPRQPELCVWKTQV